MKVVINGRPIAVHPRPLTYLRVLRTWKDGDQIRIEMPMRISLTVRRSNGDSVSVSRGPLTYSLRIGEQWVRCGGPDAWPDCEVFPTTPWNYGLVLDEADPTASFELVRKPGPQPPPQHEASFICDDITTTELRIEVRLREGFSGGILEWRCGEQEVHQNTT